MAQLPAKTWLTKMLPTKTRGSLSDNPEQIKFHFNQLDNPNVVQSPEDRVEK